MNYGVIIPASNPAALKLPIESKDFLSRFGNWGIKKFDGAQDEIVANYANSVLQQEYANVSYQVLKNQKFNSNSTAYFDKNKRQSDNWMFGPALPLVIKDFNV